MKKQRIRSKLLVHKLGAVFILALFQFHHSESIAAARSARKLLKGHEFTVRTGARMFVPGKVSSETNPAGHRLWKLDNWDTINVAGVRVAVKVHGRLAGTKDKLLSSLDLIFPQKVNFLEQGVRVDIQGIHVPELSQWLVNAAGETESTYIRFVSSAGGDRIVYEDGDQIELLFGLRWIPVPAAMTLDERELVEFINRKIKHRISRLSGQPPIPVAAPAVPGEDAGPQHLCRAEVDGSEPPIPEVAAEEEEERSDDAQGVRERRTHPGRADPPMHGAGRSRSRERRVRSSSVRAPVSGEFARENDPSQSPSPLDEDMTEAASRGGPAQLPDPVGSEPAMAQAPVSYDYPRAPEDEPAGARAPQPPAPPLFQNPTGPGFGYGPGFGVSQFPGYFAPFAGQGNYPPRPLFQNPTGPGFGYGPGPGVTLPPGYFAPIVGQCQPPAQALFQDPRRPGFVIGTGYGFPQLTVFPPTVRRPRAASSSISGTSPS